jgi:hypothetical protein
MKRATARRVDLEDLAALTELDDRDREDSR